MLRESCGGAGFSALSGLPTLQLDYAAKVSYEGDNTVMLLQSAKYLMTGVLKKKKLLGDFLGYLDDIQNQFPLKKTAVSLDSIEGIIDALRVRSAYFIHT